MAMKKPICQVTKSIKSKKKRAEFAICALKEQYPDAGCSLDYESDPFRLLCMALLSAQCTDARVNQVSIPLFERFPDARAMASGDISEIQKIIYPCGFYRVKSEHLQSLSRILCEKYGGEVPAYREALLELPGIGRKIANLMMGDLFGDPMIVPDTHMIRISNRFGLVDSTNADIVDREVSALIPKAEQSDFCHRAVMFGREFCRAQSPLCSLCPLAIKLINE